MKQPIKFLGMLAIVAGAVTFYACSDDDDDGGSNSFTLTSLTSGTTDLNGSTSATGVAVDMPIVATFSQNVDETTTGDITLTRGFDDADVPVTVAVDGKVVTVTPVNDLSGGAQFVLAINGLESEGGTSLANVSRNFTTGGTFVPDGQIAYWNFNDNVQDQAGDFDSDVQVGLTYAAGRNAAAGKAGVFNGTTSIVEVPNGDELITSSALTLSFWIDLDTASMKANGTDRKGHFVMGAGAFNGLQFEINDREEWMKFATQNVVPAPANFKGSDFFFNADGATEATIAADNAGIDNATTVDASYGKVGIRQRINGWAHIVFTYDNASGIRTLYINGEKAMEQDFDLLTAANGAGVGEQELLTETGMGFKPSGVAAGQPDYYDTKWNFGFWTSSVSTFPSWGATCCQYSGTDNNHFKGMLDDARFFHRAISAEEVTLMYNSEKP
jgi:hypothetical protein